MMSEPITTRFHALPRALRRASCAGVALLLLAGCCADPDPVPPSAAVASASRESTSGEVKSPSAAPVAIAVEVPPPLTQEQIDAMNMAQAKDAYAKVARARQLGRNLDEATKERLKNEFDMLRIHIATFRK